MTLNRQPLRGLLALALAGAIAPAFAQSPAYSQTVFFGDSLSDSGYFIPTLPPAAQGISGRSTTNPGFVWAEFLARHYGTNGSPGWQMTPNGVQITEPGTNFAIGGARMVTTPATSLQTQIDAYLERSNGQADPNALYTVWGGGNDLLDAAKSPASAATILGTAVQGTVNDVIALQNAGARYVMVPTAPDVGLTPSLRSQGAAAMAAGTALSASYTQSVFDALAAADVRVIPLDAFHFLNEVVNDPQAYGLANVTDTACRAPAQNVSCVPQAYVTPGAAGTYLFADSIHPTTIGHQMLADYAYSILEAPRQLSVLPHSAAMVGNSRAERVNSQLLARPEAEGARWWADVRGDSQRYGHGSDYDGVVPAISVGADWQNNGLTYGGYLGYGKQTINWGGNRGGFDQADTSLGGYLGWRKEAMWVTGQLGYSWLSYDMQRHVPMGYGSRTHGGSADGSNLTAGVAAGWDFEHGNWSHGPVLQLLSQTIKVDGYAEAGTLSTALTFDDQKLDSLVGSIGWRMEYAATENFHPYAKLTYDHEFKDGPQEAFARLNSMPGTDSYAVPGLRYDQNYGNLTVGLRTHVWGMQADLGGRVAVGQTGGHDATLYLGLSGGF